MARKQRKLPHMDIVLAVLDAHVSAWNPFERDHLEARPAPVGLEEAILRRYIPTTELRDDDVVVGPMMHSPGKLRV